MSENSNVYQLDPAIIVQQLVNLRNNDQIYHCYVTFKYGNVFRESSRKYFYASNTLLDKFLKTVQEVGVIKHVEFRPNPTTAPHSEIYQALQEHRVVL